MTIFALHVLTFFIKLCFGSRKTLFVDFFLFYNFGMYKRIWSEGSRDKLCECLAQKNCMRQKSLQAEHSRMCVTLLFDVDLVIG